MVKTLNRPTVRYQSRTRWDFLRHSFFLRLHSEKRKHSHPLSTTWLYFLLLRLHSRIKEKYSTQYNYSILQIEYFLLKTLQQLGPACTPPGSPGRGLLQLDRPEAVTKYKLVIPTKGIMILILWEKSFKSKEADYSNRLAKSLVASCKVISPSPWIRCDKINSPHQRWQFLGTHNLGTPRVWHN